MGKFTYLAVVAALLAVALYAATSPKQRADGAYNPSWLTQTLFVDLVTDYDNAVYSSPYAGDLKVLVVCTEVADMIMANGNRFSTGNHPAEALVPMLHLKAAGFDFEVVTPTGKPVAFEMWAMPAKDTNVLALYEELKPKFAAPLTLTDVATDLKGYAAIFIPGGHGAMNGLPEHEHLGKLLRAAHAASFPTITLCHGPGTLNAAAVGATEGEPFAYDGYKIVMFPDSLDKFTPMLGYLPGPMPWLVGESLAEKGVEILNDSADGATNVDRELVTGDSPKAANNLGKAAAEFLLKTY